MSDFEIDVVMIEDQRRFDEEVLSCCCSLGDLATMRNHLLLILGHTAISDAALGLVTCCEEPEELRVIIGRLNTISFSNRETKFVKTFSKAPCYRSYHCSPLIISTTTYNVLSN